MLATTATLGDFKKVAKRLCGLATIDDGRQCTGNVLAIIDNYGNVVAIPPQPSVASTISASVKEADRLATKIVAL